MNFIRKVIMLLMLLVLGTNLNGASLQQLSRKNGRLETVEEVYHKIAKAVLGPNAELPPIQISYKKKRVASYSPVSNRIVVEHAALDVCAKYGRDSINAIAIIVAHEFAHFLRNHSYGGSYSCRHFTKSEPLKKRMEMEQEADLYGLFSAYLAGYNIYSITGKLLEDIYDAYQLPEDLPSYPHLNIRKQINKKVTVKVTEMINIFETANYLTVMGEYSKAGSCYKALLKDYPAAELYNNFGAVLSMAVLKEIQDKNGFIYPLELDLDSKLYKDTYGAPLEYKTRELLQIALKNFDLALDYNPKNTAALINKACVYEVLEDYDASAYNITLAKRTRLSSLEKEQIEILKAITAYHNGDEQGAIAIFKQLQQGSSFAKKVAGFNIQVVEGKHSTVQFYEQSLEDNIFGMELTMNINFDKAIKVDWSDSKGALNSYYSLRTKKIKQSNLLMIQRPGNEIKAFIHKTRSQAPKTKKGIGVGTSAQTIGDKYAGNFSKTVSASDGYFIVLPSKGLVFRMNSSEKVMEWAIVKTR